MLRIIAQTLVLGQIILIRCYKKPVERFDPNIFSKFFKIIHMRKLILVIIVFTLYGTKTSAQNLKFSGPLKANKEVVQLWANYIKAFGKWKTVAERDNYRKPYVAEGYFYHGEDGSPIDFDGLTKRQTGNALSIDTTWLYDTRLFQYKNTAIVTYKTYGKGVDKGKTWEGYSSGLCVITKGKDGWKVVSDIIGYDPPAPK
jgi:hypothetical protein